MPEMLKKHWLLVLIISASSILLVLAAINLALFSELEVSRLANIWMGVQALGTILTAIAVVIAFAQVREARKQIRDNRDWNKMSFALTFLPHQEKIHEWEDALEKSIKFISRHEPLGNDELLNVYKDHATFLTLRNYLNALESYALAINKGLADEDTAKKKYRLKMTSHFSEMKPFIDEQRRKLKSDSVFCELEEIHKKWTQVPKPATVRYGDE